MEQIASCSVSAARSHRGFNRGFTIVEMLVVCAILATLMGFATPAFRELALNARRTDQVNALLRALHTSRSAAISRGEAVVLCKSSSGVECTPQASGWNEGWIVFVNTDRDSPPALDPEEQVLLRQTPVAGLSIHANRDSLTYWPFSLAGTTASFTFCDERGASAARAIVVSQTGRPRTSDRDSAGRLLQCPA